MAAALAFVHFRETPPVAEPVRFKAALPENVNFTITGMSALSPDGRKLAFSAAGADGIPRVWIRSLDSLVAQPLSGSETVPILAALFWSPDSRFLAFHSEGNSRKSTRQVVPRWCCATHPTVRWRVDPGIETV